MKPLRCTESRRDDFVSLVGEAVTRAAHRREEGAGCGGLSGRRRRVGVGWGGSVKGEKGYGGTWCDQKEGGGFLVQQMGFLGRWDS